MQTSVTDKQLAATQRANRISGPKRYRPGPSAHNSFQKAALLGFWLLLPRADSLAAGNQDNLCPLGNWNPKIEFQFEKATYKETLIWLSGWSYALTAVGQSEAKSASPKYCLPKCGLITSKVLLDMLNEAYKGQTISSEQATQVLWAGVPAIYKCEGK